MQLITAIIVYSRSGARGVGRRSTHEVMVKTAERQWQYLYSYTPRSTSVQKRNARDEQCHLL
eukprot:10837002-Prorocentrum_lima.AAC.1